MKPQPRTRRERGSVAIIVALALPLLIGFIALCVDFGHFWEVRSELHNAADSAALAGIRDLDGTVAKFLPARQSAQLYAVQHQANLTPVQLNLNLANDAGGDSARSPDRNRRRRAPSRSRSPRDRGAQGRSPVGSSQH